MKRIVAICSLLTALLTALPASAGEPQGIYVDVIRMLDAGLSEELIVNWLVGDDRPVPVASADDLIGLKTAGATDGLLDQLLELSRNDADPAPRPMPEEPAEPAHPIQPASPTRAETMPTPAAAPRSDSGSDPLVSFRLAYTPPKVDFDHELWNLYVYLDGEPLAYVPPNTSFADRGDALEFRQRLAPGAHLLIVTQERHDRKGRKRWHHQARVSSQGFAFEVSPDYDGEAELTFNEGVLGTNSGGPLTFRFVQSDQVTELESVGGQPDSWAPVCEEIEANVAEGEKPGRSVEADLARCVRWSDLWEGIAGPTRSQIREALAAFDFRPVPRGS